MKTYEERLPLIDEAIKKLVDFDNQDCWRFEDSDEFLWDVEGIYQRLNKSTDYSGEYVSTREEFNQRKAELQNKPSFAGHPDAKCFVQNDDGWWWKNTVTNKIDSYVGGYWVWINPNDIVDDNGWVRLQQGTVIGNWQDTLEKRPEQNKEDTVENVKSLLKDGMRCIDRDGDTWYVCGGNLYLPEYRSNQPLSAWHDNLKDKGGNALDDSDLECNDIMRIIDRDGTVVWEREEVKVMTKTEAEATLTDTLHVTVKIV